MNFFKSWGAVGKIPPLLLILIAASNCNARATPLTSHSAMGLSQKQEAARLVPGKDFKGMQVDFVGFVDHDTIILTLWSGKSNDSGHIVKWNLRSKKVVAQTPLSKWLDSRLCLASDGKTLTTTNVRTNSAFPQVKAVRITTLSSANLKTRFTKDIPRNQDVVGTLNFETNSHYVVFQRLYAVPINKNEATFAKDQFQWFNTRAGDFEKSLSYSSAREWDKLAFSPNKKFLLSFFYSEEFDPNGENDYLKDQSERHGFIDILDYKTGKILWHLEGTDQQPVGDPFFFISPTRFISSDTVFNIQTRTARHWNAITPTRKCLAAVPNHTNYALFLTPGGLKLRDWQKDKTLATWPGIKKTGRILFSPDLKTFSFKRGSTIQFWKFDPKWLR